MNKLNNLTVIIVTFLTSKKILLNCLKSIDKRVKVIIVENSSSFKDEKFFLKKFPNLKVFCSGLNLGYGGGNNFGLNKTKTDYALILNPDTILDKSFCNNLKKILKNKNFSIIGCQYSNEKIYVPAGYFDSSKDQLFKKKYFKEKFKSLIKVDWVVGCAMLLNLKKIKKKHIFDNNFFLYFEEFDLCKSLIKEKKNIYLSKDLKIHHLGFKSSQSKNTKFVHEIEKLRNWHWMWSYFYFYKKNYNYFYALNKIFGKLSRSFFKSIFYFITFDVNNRDKYLYRFLGLLNSIVGKKSSYRGKIFN